MLAQRILVVGVGKEREEAEDLLPAGGEREVYRLFQQIRSATDSRIFPVSDDHRFLSRLALLNIRGITPGAVLVLAAREGFFEVAETLAWLEAMRPTISSAEYEVSRACAYHHQAKGGLIHGSGASAATRSASQGDRTGG